MSERSSITSLIGRLKESKAHLVRSTQGIIQPASSDAGPAGGSAAGNIDVTSIKDRAQRSLEHSRSRAAYYRDAQRHLHALSTCTPADEFMECLREVRKRFDPTKIQTRVQASSSQCARKDGSAVSPRTSRHSHSQSDKSTGAAQPGVSHKQKATTTPTLQAQPAVTAQQVQAVSAATGPQLQDRDGTIIAMYSPCASLKKAATSSVGPSSQQAMDSQQAANNAKGEEHQVDAALQRRLESADTATDIEELRKAVADADCEVAGRDSVMPRAYSLQQAMYNHARGMRSCFSHVELRDEQCKLARARWAPGTKEHYRTLVGCDNVIAAAAVVDAAMRGHKAAELTLLRKQTIPDIEEQLDKQLRFAQNLWDVKVNIKQCASVTFLFSITLFALECTC